MVYGDATVSDWGPDRVGSASFQEIDSLAEKSSNGRYGLNDMNVFDFVLLFLGWFFIWLSHHIAKRRLVCDETRREKQLIQSFRVCWAVDTSDAAAEYVNGRSNVADAITVESIERSSQ